MKVQLKCQCGTMRGWAETDPLAQRLVCLCDDCQAYAHYLGQAKQILDANGGTDVFPVTPRDLHITKGIEQLKYLRLTDKGMFRWYAGCCHTAIANSMPSSKAPFAGVVHTIMDHASDGLTRDQALGPVRARIYGKYGIGTLPPGTYQTASFAIILRVMRFLLKAAIGRKYHPSPFFDHVTGKPRVEPYLLTAEERERLRPLCGPRPG